MTKQAHRDAFSRSSLGHRNSARLEPGIPDDFKAALTEAADISELWEDITPIARWEWVRWTSATKNPDTRARRVEVGVSKLRSSKRRPCCFDLVSCTDPELSKTGKLVDG